MRVARIDVPWGMYLGLVPAFAGSLFAGLGRWTPAVILFVLGGACFIGGGLLFARRVSKLRSTEQLTSRDLVEVEYPRWARRVARGYLMLVAGMMGVAILASVIFVVLAVATR